MRALCGKNASQGLLPPFRPGLSPVLTRVDERGQIARVHSLYPLIYTRGQILVRPGQAQRLCLAVRIASGTAPFRPL